LKSFKDVRALILDEYDLNIQQAADVFDFAWQGGKLLANSNDFDELVIKKKAYEENHDLYSSYKGFSYEFLYYYAKVTLGRKTFNPKENRKLLNKRY